MGWLSDHLWALWLGIALLLACAEMLTLDLTLLMLAAGALAAAGVAVILPGLWIVQVLVGAVVALAMLGFLRPTMLAKVRNAPGYRNSISQLLGSRGQSMSEITADGGEVKVDGQVWAARTMDPSLKVAAGQPVEIYEVDGTTLVVHPIEPGLPYGQYGALGQ